MASRTRTWLSVILCFAFILNGLPASAPNVSASSRASEPAQGLSDPSPQKASSAQGNEAVARADAALAVSDNLSTGSRATASALIAITASGFEPAAITVEAGTEVAWKNETAQTHVLKSGEPYAIYLPLILRQGPGAGPLSASAQLSRTTPLRTASDDFMATISSGDTFTHTFITEGEHPYYLVTDFKQRGRVTVTGSIPPDPGTIAPPVDLTVPTTVISSTLFLYTGTDPIQTGVAPGTIEAQRVAVLRGRVLANGGAPLPGVTVTVLDHPEFGRTLTRADGMYDMAVNGGGLLTLNYEKPNYLAGQRQVQTPWEDYVWLDDVVLIGLDSNVAEIDLTSAVPIQVAQGSVVSDDDGTRQATLLIPKGTAAELVLPGGITQTLTTLNVRATEYTIGDQGPQRMPAELPAQSGYTYAVELSADEAIAAGASDVRFSQPLYFYVENFLNFPVGGIVPVGYYDREWGAWIPSPNGRIIRIVTITGGLADLDTDGNGVADNDASLGITDAERRELAARYTADQSLWRVPVAHFTPWDCNWPYGPPAGAAAPGQPDPNQSDPSTDDPSCQGGSIIECESQTLREAMPIAGTPFTLNYGSDRVPGRISERSPQIPLSGASLPPNLKRIDLEVTVAGRRFTQTFLAQPDQRATFTWDGLDAYGRAVQGRQPISTHISYVYDAVYMQPAPTAQAFGLYSGIPITGSRARQEVELGQEWQGTIGSWDAEASGLGGWSLDVHHAYDAQSNVLYLGHGGQRRAENLSAIITTIAGNGTYGYGGDGGPAIQARLSWPHGVAIGSNITVYIADSYNHRIRRVGPDGIITTMAGNGTQGYGGDGGPATQAILARPVRFAIGTDGSLFFTDESNNRIRRIGPDGIITTVAGNGTQGYGGDGSPAIQATLGIRTGSAWARSSDSVNT